MRLSRGKFFKTRMAVLAAAAAGGGYALLVRPRMLSWGATDDEAVVPMPADEVITNPKYTANHAVTVNAPASVVWSWLLRMAQGNDGFDGLNWLEKLLGLQYEISAVDHGRHLVLGTPGSQTEVFSEGKPFGTWTFMLTEINAETTRLVARSRIDFSRNFAGLVWNKYGLEPIRFMMEQRALLQIKKRAESSVSAGGRPQEMAAVSEPAQAAA